jgi:opacity protein-like surface antigen
MKKYFILFFFLSTTVWAKENQIDFMLGRGTPQSSAQVADRFQLLGSRGPEWSVDIMHRIARQLSLGLGGGHFSSGDNTSTTWVSNTNSTLSSHMSTVFILGRLDLAPNPKFIPYLLAGVGWARSSLSATATPVSTWADTGTAESRLILDDAKISLGYAAAAGVDIALNDRIFVGVEARYQAATARNFDLTAQGRAVTGQNNVDSAIKMIILGVKAAVRY